MSDIIIINNFFTNFDNIKNEFKTISRYNQTDFNKKFEETQTWPGERSENLTIANPFFFNLFLFNCKQHDFFKKKLHILSLYTHLRLEDPNDQDWIHIDNCTYTMLVYLSDTFLTSGTNFYLEKNEASLTHKVAFIQNTAVIFKGNIFHKSNSNYGKSIDDGRLTLNCFFNLDA